MFVLGNLFIALAQVLAIVLNAYVIVIFVAVILSWVNPDPFNPIVRILRSLTEPVFQWIRRRLPFTMLGGIDFSPLVALLVIVFAQTFVVRTLQDLGQLLR